MVLKDNGKKVHVLGLLWAYICVCVCVCVCMYWGFYRHAYMCVCVRVRACVRVLCVRVLCVCELVFLFYP